MKEFPECLSLWNSRICEIELKAYDFIIAVENLLNKAKIYLVVVSCEVSCCIIEQLSEPRLRHSLYPGSGSDGFASAGVIMQSAEIQ